MSDTPRTDAATSPCGEYDGCFCTSANVSRQLERELAAANEQNEELRRLVAELFVGKHVAETIAAEIADKYVKANERIKRLEEALSANRVFHTPIALRRRGGKWDEYELDAIRRTREEIGATQTKAKEAKP